MADQTDSFYLDKAEPVKSCLLALRTLILQFDGRLSETRKYGMPCFTLGKRPFCYLWTDRKTGEPYILIVEGRTIEHPALETGKRARMKILRVDPIADIPLDTIREVLTMALALYAS